MTATQESSQPPKPAAGVVGIFIAALLMGAQSIPADTGHFNEQGYRHQRYRAPLPSTVPGGQTIKASELQPLIQQQSPVLIDVQAITLRTEAAEFGISWLPNAPRHNIPGSSWLPNVGYGTLEPFMTAYFSDNLQRLTSENKQQALVFYCIADCWMSWNAVQRASQWGYTNLYWLAGGTDEWAAAGGKLEVGTPEPILAYLTATK